MKANDVQRFGQTVAVAILTLGPLVAAVLWINHVITDSESVAGSLAVNSALFILALVIVLGTVLAVGSLLFFWVWVFGVAWSSDEARGKVSDV